MKVAIIGTGVMGTQIYNYLQNYDLEVCLLSHNASFDKLKKHDLIIESIIENLHAKKNLFRTLNKICNKNTIFASNTSSLSIEDMQIPYRDVVGLHFMNPVNRIDTIEVIYPRQITNITILRISNFLNQIQKKYFVVSDRKGFVVNRLLITLIHEALKLTESEDPEVIDKLMLNCCKFPVGPLKLGDIIGWDVILNICQNIEIEPCLQLRDLIYAQKLGRKTKEGVYKYH